MAILGGKGTLWGPVIGATVFHIFKEGFWTFFLGWQYVALGVLIVVIVIYFPGNKSQLQLSKLLMLHTAILRKMSKILL